MSEQDSAPRQYPETILDDRFQFVKNRLRGGAVYHDPAHDLYLRLDERETALAEQVATYSLHRKGFPVARIVEEGELGDQHYFIEESLGDKPLGMHFQENGKASEQDFEDFLQVMQQYCQASFGPQNRHKRGEEVREISLFEKTVGQYDVDVNQLENLLHKASKRLQNVPQATINTDLGPFNIMRKGIIDFEFLHTGPIGYDIVTVPTVGYYFPRVSGYFHRLAYEFDESQLQRYYSMVGNQARAAGLESPTRYINDFLFIKTLWAAARPQHYENVKVEDPEKERFWSEFRANILSYVIKSYDQDTPIEFTMFPEIGVSGHD